MKLNLEQRKAVEHKQGPLMIVAGAGTGKTTVITRRIVHLIENKLAQPNEILGLTFTDKAAQEMEERVDKLLPYGVFDLQVSTFHSFCQGLLQDHGLCIGLPTDFQLLDQTSAWVLIRQNLDKFDLDYYKPLGNPAKFIHALLSHFSRCKDEGIYPEDYLKYSDKLRTNLDEIPIGAKAVKPKDKKDLAIKQEQTDKVVEIANAYHVYQQLLLHNNCLDFGDLLGYVYQLFKKRPGILKQLQNQYKYILVDEFQDTNWIQYEIVKQLAKPENNLTVCADDDQSIYKFRGASFNNVLQFRQDYPKLSEVVINTNYRSKQNILDLAYKSIQFNNPNRLEYKLNQDKKLVEQAGKKGIKLGNFRAISKKLTSAVGEKGKLEHIHFNTLEQEVAGVVEKIKQLKKQDKQASWSDFAILVRANNNAVPFNNALERAQIPYYFFASRGLYGKSIVLDILAYFKALNNCLDNEAMYRLFNLRFNRVEPQDIAQISTYARRKSLSLYQAVDSLSLIKLSNKASEKIKFLLNLIKKHSQLVPDKKPSELLINFLTDSGYLDYLNKQDSLSAKQDLDYLNQFLDRIKQFESSSIDTNLANFLQELQWEIEAGEQGQLKFDPDKGPDMVRVMTVHSAKGLEFKYVFLVNLVDQRFPTRARGGQINLPEDLVKEVAPNGNVHIQEERRLFYVGATRAKQGLFFTSADDYGGKRTKKLSRFLKELGFEKEQSQQTQSEKLKIKKTKKKKQKIKTSQLPLPKHFSFTQIIAFSNCPLQYKFRHLLKIPMPGKAQFSFGRTLHNTLYYFIKKDLAQKNNNQASLFGQDKKIKAQSGLLKELLYIYKKQWINDWFDSQSEKQKYFQLGKKILKEFYKKWVKQSPQVLYLNHAPALEKSFKLKLDNNIIVGKIDRIDQLGDEIVKIIDYKTGKTPQKLKKDHKEQLMIYYLAGQQCFNLRKIELSVYYLRDNKELSFIPQEKQVQEFKRKLIQIIQKIKQSNFKPTPGYQCRFCDFKNICEYGQK